MIKPVTARSTLLVKNRFEPTEIRRNTRSSASAAAMLPRALSAEDEAVGGEALLSTKILGGIFPRTFSSGRFTGRGDPGEAAESSSLTSPLPVTTPTYATGTRSRSHMAEKSDVESAEINRASDSWYSAPQSSRTLRDASPETTLRMSMRPPAGEIISLRTLQFPPAPWSWIDTIGFAAPSSQHARMTRFTLCSICASPRCTALKSRSALLSP